jgi:HK97 family phage prohead protease
METTMPPSQTLSPIPQTTDDIVNPEPDFKIFTGTMKAYDKPDDTRKYLRCTASSTIEDLHGDRMTEDCVMGMAPQAKAKGMTIFLNHKYEWPEDVFGKTVDATIVSRSKDADGRAIYDLDLEIQLNEANKRALESYAAIKEQGIKAGVSIGAMIEDWSFIDEDQGFYGGININAIDLLEASVVGIPANQRSWVVNALKSLGAPKLVIRKALGLATPQESPGTGVVMNGIEAPADGTMTTLTVEPDATFAEWDTAYINNLPDSAFACIDPGGTKDEGGKTTPRSKRHYPHHNAAGELDEAHLNNALSRIGDSSNTQCGAAHLKKHKGSSDSEKDVEPMLTAACPECGKGHDAEGCSNDYHASIYVIEDSTAPATETPVEEESEELEPADPETGLATLEDAGEAIDTLKATGADSALLDIVLGFLEGATEEVASLRKALAAVTEERDALRGEVNEAIEIVETLAATPIGRKAQFAGPVTNFRSRFGGFYDESFLKALEGVDNE